MTVPLFTPEPYPEYLLGVFPQPGVTITRDELMMGSQLLQPGVSEGLMAQVCLDIRFQPLMERGDSFDNINQWLPRLRVTIDGNPHEVPIITFTTDLFYFPVSDPETGEFLYQVPQGGPATICYDNEFTTGPHVVEAEILRTSGAVERYRWWFILTDD